MVLHVGGEDFGTSNVGLVVVNFEKGKEVTGVSGEGQQGFLQLGVSVGGRAKGGAVESRGGGPMAGTVVDGVGM